ncbi:MAG TPA: NAD(P)-dependent alcohol dehydrogenase, partial [Microbacteriaceae bacterium]
MNNCLIIHSEGEQLTRGVIDRGELEADEIEVEVYFCGVCHSDIHQGKNDWGRAVFPLVPGHEVTGIVKSIGTAVSKFAIGDRVGVGVFKDSCGECEMCVSGKENYCLKGRTQTYNAPLPNGERTKGGYAHTLHARESFAHHIPENLPLDAAAPLLCAGITTYAPLKKWGVGEGSKVAVVGVGGLGHMAIKFAAALGAEVSVIGRNDSKKQDAFDFGAADFLITDEEFEAKASYFDLVLNASSSNLGVDKYLKILKPEGVLV